MKIRSFDGLPLYQAISCLGNTCANVEFYQANLYQNHLCGIRLRDCVFECVDMDEVNLEYAQLENVIFEGCMMCDINFKNAMLINVEFYDVMLFRTDFSSSKLTQVRFYGVDMKETKFLKSTLSEVSLLKDNMLHKTDVSSVDFTKAICDKVVFDDVVSDNYTVLPEASRGL